MDGVPSNITCQKIPVFGLILISIFLINITILIYISYKQTNPGYYADPFEAGLMSFFYIVSLIYYILILTITYFYSKPPSCNPFRSLLFHPVIFSVVVIYIIGLAMDTIINLYNIVTGATTGDAPGLAQHFIDVYNQNQQKI